MPLSEGAPGAGREGGEDEADAEAGVADEQELLRQAKVLPAVRQEQRHRDGQPHRRRSDGRPHFKHLRIIGILKDTQFIRVRSGSMQDRKLILCFC